MKTAKTSVNNYYPFGMLQPGYSYSSETHRFGFNGMEKDDEIKGTGNSLDFGARIYDPRLGRFLSVDPLMQDYPWFTPYQFAGLDPVNFIDLAGNEPSWKDPTTGFIIPASDHHLTNPPKNAIFFNTSIRTDPIEEFQSFLEFTDVNDFAIITSSMRGDARNIKGEPASTTDILITTGGIFIPAISGSGIKKLGSEAIEWLTKTIGKNKNVVAEGIEKAKHVHGNSLKSPKETTLYRLEGRESGDLLKWGITSEVPIEKRYSKKFLEDKIMNRIESGSRKEMFEKERKLVEENPGPLNKEPWSGKNSKK